MKNEIEGQNSNKKINRNTTSFTTQQQPDLIASGQQAIPESQNQNLSRIPTEVSGVQKLAEYSDPKSGQGKQSAKKS